VAPILRLDDVWFSWPGGPRVLESVSFEIARGAFVSVVGPNGGGKTTLLKLLLGLLEPDRGRVEVLGGPPLETRSRVGYMPQHADVDFRFPVHVLDVVSMGRLGPRLRLGGHSSADRDAAAAAIARVGLEGLERRPFSDLSGGQRQRALLARALVSGPELLLLDEPEAGLDRKEDLYDLLGELNREATVVVVSHDLGLVSHLVETVVCVRGRVEVHRADALDGGTVRELYGRDMHLVQHEHGS